MNPKIDIMICTKDRPTELFGLLQSLRTQTYQDFDIYIYDDRSGKSPMEFYFLSSIISRLKIEDHRIVFKRNDIAFGVTKLRQILVEEIMDIGRGDMILRLDDDNLLQPDYIERLVKVLDKGFDIASGLVPHFATPQMKRETRFVKPFIADITLNNGELVIGDDCGMEYLEDEIIPSPHFRSMALIKKEVHKKVSYEVNLGHSSWREEEFFSLRAIALGFKIGVDTKAIAYHIQTPSGGERTKEFADGMKTNDRLLNELYNKLCKKHGEFLTKYKDSK